MSGGAIVMMLLAMLLLWGGLAAAIWNLRRGQTPEVEDVHRDL